MLLEEPMPWRPSTFKKDMHWKRWTLPRVGIYLLAVLVVFPLLCVVSWIHTCTERHWADDPASDMDEQQQHFMDHH